MDADVLSTKDGGDDHQFLQKSQKAIQRFVTNEAGSTARCVLEPGFKTTAIET